MLYDKKWDEKLPVNTDGFKTAAELGLSDHEYKTLVKTLALFESGQVPAHMFDMRRIGNPACGTAGCLLGWVHTIDETCFTGWEYWAIRDLFSPEHSWATEKDGAIALRNYLTTGCAKWMEIYHTNHKDAN